MYILVKQCHKYTNNYNYTLFDVRVTSAKSLHVRDVYILVIRDFLCILHRIL